jgi:hypothetical protein
MTGVASSMEYLKQVSCAHSQFRARSGRVRLCSRQLERVLAAAATPKEVLAAYGTLPPQVFDGVDRRVQALLPATERDSSLQ